MRIKNLMGGSVRSDLKKNRLLHLGNVEKPPHPQLFAQRAPEGYNKFNNYSMRSVYILRPHSTGLVSDTGGYH